MSWITVYDERGTDHFINTAHIVRIVKGAEGERTRIMLTSGGCLIPYATPSANTIDDVHQDVLDQISGRA